MAFHHSPNIVKEGLVLCMDAADKNSYPGSGTTWSDLSPTNDNDGTLTNGPTFSTAGGGTIVFDGNNDHVRLGDSIGALGSTSATFSAWIYRTNSSGYDYFFDAREASGKGYCQGNSGDNVVNASEGTIYVDGVATNALVVGGWHHLTITGMTIETTESFIIGSYHSGTDFLHLGNIATVHVYNRVLSVKELQHNFNATRTRFGVGSK